MGKLQHVLRAVSGSTAFSLFFLPAAELSDGQDLPWRPIGEPYDYCQLTEESNTIDRVMAREAVPFTVLYEMNREAIRSLELSAENIVHRGSHPYRFLLVPVGYSDPELFQERLEYFSGFLSRAFQGVPVSFPYLNQSVPLGIAHADRYAVLTDYSGADMLREHLEPIFPVQGMAFVFHTPDTVPFSAMGSSDQRYTVFAGDLPQAPSTAIHEIGHYFGLGDGYNRFYQPSELPGTELFLSVDALPALLRDAYDAVQPPPYWTGNFCMSQPILTFYRPGTDVMDRTFSTTELERLLMAGESPFNRLQREIMNRFVRERLGLP